MTKTELIINGTNYFITSFVLDTIQDFLIA
jgi:hypothetical protein